MRSERFTAAGGDEPVRTMEEFALFVGLSRPTVSRFFNDPTGLKASTRQRIEAALETSGFRPNLLASNLVRRRNPVRRRSRILGLIVPDPADPFYAALARHVEASARAAGFQAFVLSSNGDPDREADAVATLASMSAAGAILAPLGAPERARAAIPLVYVDSRPAGAADFVGTDNRDSFRRIVSYLCRTGSPPRLLGMPAVNRNATERAEGYAAAMREAGHEPRFLALPDRRDWDFERFGFEAAHAWIASGDAGGATILCANDRLAFGALAAAFERGLRVGPAGDLRVAGHDDHPLSRYACPPLTTVAQDFDAIGGGAVDLLMRRIRENNEAAPTVTLLPARVVERRSA